MARDSQGAYTLASGNPVASNTAISTTWANATLNDIATEIADSLSRSGKGAMTAILKVVDGTGLSAPGVAFASEPTSGLYRAAAGSVHFTVLGTSAMHVSSAGMVMQSVVASGSSADAFTLNTTNTLSAGNLWVVKNNTTQKFSVDYAGNTTAQGFVKATSFGTVVDSFTITSGSDGTIIDSPTATTLLDVQANGTGVFAISNAGLVSTTGTNSGFIVPVSGLGSLPTPGVSFVGMLRRESQIAAIDKLFICLAGAISGFAWYEIPLGDPHA